MGAAVIRAGFQSLWVWNARHYRGDGVARKCGRSGNATRRLPYRHDALTKVWATRGAGIAAYRPV
ncbi:hypothetical protein HYPDE_40063 [Hyphomicrobium denitrificans 1NES1]|uniref:Uncharacterized protein n=1 Tax=Hyphomicrobium denitrificans 1NES1 TaxID=670307 RepID=N0BGW3_9HYPH|nr:hypothetical protein HYPDE_40063 [Hyphomicrobium denitrificans 1NES1]